MVSPTRPLSPYLHYRWRHTNTLSFLHRIAGLMLSLGLLLLICWLMSLASGPKAYARASAVLSMSLFTLVYPVLLIAFAYHLVAGIRHLVWDSGRGLEREAARRSALLLAFLVILLVLGSGYLLFAWRHVS